MRWARQLDISRPSNLYSNRRTSQTIYFVGFIWLYISLYTFPNAFVGSPYSNAYQLLPFGDIVGIHWTPGSTPGTTCLVNKCSSESSMPSNVTNTCTMESVDGTLEGRLLTSTNRGCHPRNHGACVRHVRVVLIVPSHVLFDHPAVARHPPRASERHGILQPSQRASESHTESA